MTSRTLRSLAGGVVVVLLGVLAFKLTREDEATATAASRPDRPAPPGGESPAPARTRPQLEVPRWPSVDGDEVDLAAATERARGRFVKHAELPNGLYATFYPTRTQIPKHGELVVQLELADRDDAPVMGRADLEIVVMEDDEVYKAGFTEDPDHPGTYRSRIQPHDPEAQTVRALTVVSETGLIDTPGAVASLDVAVDHHGDGLLVGPPAGTWSDAGYAVAVGVRTTAPTTAWVRAELWYRSGSTAAVLGEATARAELAAGDGVLVLEFPGSLPDGVDPTSATLLLADTTLYTGASPSWTDFWPTQTRIVPRTAADD